MSTRPTREQIADVLVWSKPAGTAFRLSDLPPHRQEAWLVRADAVLALLDTMPTAEEVWDAGHTAGHINAHEWRPGRQLDNPYREG